MKLDTVFDTDDEAQFLYGWFFKRDKVLVDNIIFYLHYHVSVALFFVGCLLVTIAMYIMDPIDCIADNAVDEIIDNFCLYHSTYTMSGVLNRSTEILSHPGIQPNRTLLRDGSKYHNYYLWVAMVLALQASSFYIPRGLWKFWEGSRVQLILDRKRQLWSCEKTKLSNEQNGVESGENVATSTKEAVLKWECLSKYMLSKSHNSYYWKLLFCELLNLVNVIAQLLIMDMFMGFGFSQLKSFEFLQLIQETRPFERTDAVELMFPKVTACTFYSYGPSGNVINYEALCVLPVNSLNEKVFGIIYIWLLFLICLSFLALSFRLLFLSKRVRRAILSTHINSDEIISEDLSLSSLQKNKDFGMGNWQLLCQLGGNSNIDQWEYTKIVQYLCQCNK